MSDEQTSEQPVTTQVATQEKQAPSDAWGQPISEERQVELQGYLVRWQAEKNHGVGKGPFDQVPLTGADVYWLAEQSGRDELGTVSNLHLEGASLRGAQLEDAILSEAHLGRAILD